MSRTTFLNNCVKCPKSGYVQIVMVNDRLSVFLCDNNKCNFKEKVTGLIIDNSEVNLFERNHLYFEEDKPVKRNRQDYKLIEIIKECFNITRSKGFKPAGDIGKQTMLIATEVAEALECLDLDIRHDQMQATAVVFTEMMKEFEESRRKENCEDKSYIKNADGFLEELSDVCIRIFSLIGDLNMIDSFIVALTDKMDKNRQRPYLHGKKF